MLSGGCSFAPKYQRPAVQTPTAFKELTPQSPEATNLWKMAQPSDAALRGKWWEMFTNAQLNALEEQVAVSNQNVAAAFANFLSARALVKEARAQLFPTLAANPAVTRSRQPVAGEPIRFLIRRRDADRLFASAGCLLAARSLGPDSKHRERERL